MFPPKPSAGGAGARSWEGTTTAGGHKLSRKNHSLRSGVYYYGVTIIYRVLLSDHLVFGHRNILSVTDL